MKKMLSIVICILLSISLFGCSSGDVHSDIDQTNSVKAAQFNNDNSSESESINSKDTKKDTGTNVNNITVNLNKQNDDKKSVDKTSANELRTVESGSNINESKSKKSKETVSETAKEKSTERSSETTTENPAEPASESAEPVESTETPESSESTEETTTESPEEPAPEAQSEPSATDNTTVSYSPGNVVALATSKCKAGGMITTTDNLANLLAEGKITEDEYNEYYPYDGLGYYSVFVETDLNVASTTSGRKLGSEQGIADYIADMLLLEREPYFLIEYSGESSGFYEFRCYR